MIIADATVWSAALAGQVRAWTPCSPRCASGAQVSAPAAVFAEVLSECDDERSAAQVRAWALEAAPVNETGLAWLASGDLGARLRAQGVMLSSLDTFLVTLCVREGWQLWTMNSGIHRVAASLPIRLHDPPGLSSK
ncbi:MAG: hypothetical protein R3F43_03380 [bacterium]